MNGQIRETADEVVALIPRYSWELMDEDQRDALIEKVVVKRYMATTKDGVELGPKWWAKVLGTTDHAIRGRVRRAEQPEPASATAPTASDMASIRSAKAAIRKHPELAGKLYDDPKVKDAVDEVVLASSGQTTRTSGPKEPRKNSFDLWAIFAAVNDACDELVRVLPDYQPDDDWRWEAARSAGIVDSTATFLRAWAKGTDVTADAEKFLADWAAASE